MIHRLGPPPRAFDENRQVRACFGLTDEIIKRLRPQGAVGILGHGCWAKGWVGLCHVMLLWLRRKARATPYSFGAKRRSAARISAGASDPGALPAASATARAASDGA